MGLFYKNNGTISVFLCLILLPVILVGGMTVDASRIALSKVVISDAGEMAMNAGLAQYNEELHDEYGLLVMDQSPEAMSGQLEEFFNTSLNGSGLPDAEDYQKILDLLEENFSAIGVAGSEIYRTEVEKQQIIEYMKYRAPVCLTELVLEKIGMFKDTELMVDAMDAQVDFSEAMEDCQDTFEKALEALNALNQAVENFPSNETIKQELENTERDYKETVSRCLLMQAVIQQYDYDEYYQSTDLKAMAEGFIEAAKKVDMSAPDSSGTFDNYIKTMKYANSVSHLSPRNGVRQLLQDYDSAKAEEEAEREQQEAENGTAPEQPAQEETVDEEREELQELVNEYETQATRISGYSDTLWTMANNAVTTHHNALNGYREGAEEAERCAKTAYDCLEDVKDALDKAEEKFNVWNGKYNELREVGKEGGMQNDIDEYKEFFTSEQGKGKSDKENLEDLMAKVSSNEGFFKDIKNVLKNEKFFTKSIASDSASSQMNRYMSEASSAAGRISADYFSVEIARNSFASNSNYEHVEVSSSHSKQNIDDDPFYKQLKDYCKEGAGNGDPEKQQGVNDTLDQSQNSADDVKKTEGYPDFDWGTLEIRLPSSVEGASVRDVNSDLTEMDIDSNVSSSSARGNIITEFQDSIHAASSFLNGVDRIIAGGIENLYIAEYTMQMFSYYTVDKEDGQPKAEQDIISLSGYGLQDRPAYRAEAEYILWGDQSSQKNVGNTIMMIFGIRLLFNSFYAFTDSTINGIATGIATPIAAGAPYLIPIIKAVIKLGYAGVETANDISKIKQGYGVTILKDSSSWATMNGGDNTSGVTFDYSEYLRIFLNVSILDNKIKADILGRIADCIQADQQSVDLFTSYTMIQIDAEVSTRTTFMRKISDFGSGGWGFPDDTYSISYQSVLGY